MLTQRIVSSDLPPGSLLKEAAIASHIGISRAPVRKAILMLVDAGLIRPASGQGYIVGDQAARRLSSRDLHSILSPATEEIDRTVSWERIFTQTANEVTSVLPFGNYRIQEAELGTYYNVSRTVAREVLWRLKDARLIEKDRKSHWIVGQMTARDVRDSFEMRRALEPRALVAVAPDIDKRWLTSLAERVERALAIFPACGAEEIDAIEHELFHVMFDGLKNARMLSSIRRNQVALCVPRLFRQHFPLRDDRPALVTYSQIIRLMESGALQAAQVLLSTRLTDAEALTLARLRVLAILPPPRTVPYMFSVR